MSFTSVVMGQRHFNCGHEVLNRNQQFCYVTALYINIKLVKSCHINHLLVLKVQEFEHVNGQWSMPWMADLEEGKNAVVLTESPEKTPSSGTPADTQPNSPTPGNAT